MPVIKEEAVRVGRRAKTAEARTSSLYLCSNYLQFEHFRHGGRIVLDELAGSGW